ncbi:hypothetical protein M153_1426000996 [Pseudoloma neurophilia]|uniref:Uncharacterized protein n=1 Tax=Pseudoloma neurophilia TaxID=146866 RepID=A0A0R0M187_9MICR|nr:hypothetical protein M153_1426000996 [Pseudoloma neurophilia]
MDELSEVKTFVRNLDEKSFEKHKDLIEKHYDSLDVEEMAQIFPFTGKYPENFDENTFNNLLIEKYVTSGKPEDDYVMTLIKDKQMIFDMLLDTYCKEKNTNQQYFIIEKIIFLFLEFGKSIKIRNDHLINLTNVMNLQLSFVLAAFFAQNEKILDGTPFAEIFLQRLVVYKQRMSGKCQNHIEQKTGLEVENEPFIDLPNTLQEAIEEVDECRLSPDIFTFYIFTAPVSILKIYKNSLFRYFLLGSSPIFFTVFIERTEEVDSVLEYFFTKCCESERKQIIQSFKLLQETKIFVKLQEQIKQRLKREKVSQITRDELKKVFVDII